MYNFVTETNFYVKVELNVPSVKRCCFLLITTGPFWLCDLTTRKTIIKLDLGKYFY